MAGTAAIPLAVRTEDDLPELVQMQASYAVILRRSALATAPAAAVMIVLSGIIGSGKGLVGALLGVGLVIIFFGIDALALSWAARHSPQVMMATAVGTYLVKILALLILVAKYSGTTAFNGKLFGLTVVVCVIVYTTALALIAARLKVPYVEPAGEQVKVPYAEPDGKR
jgi:ATP synthase protein I